MHSSGLSSIDQRMKTISLYRRNCSKGSALAYTSASAMRGMKPRNYSIWHFGLILPTQKATCQCIVNKASASVQFEFLIYPLPIGLNGFLA
jgi:hypothetical protein